jgi:hypothetical protein
MRLALALGCVVALAPSLARADSVHLKGGRVLEGAASVEGDKVAIELESGRVSVPLAEVERIERATPALERAEQRERALAPGDAAGLLKLADFCREHDLLGRERALLERILTIAPEHAEARRRLGFVRTSEGWTTGSALKQQRQRESARAERDEHERELARLELQEKQAELAQRQDTRRAQRQRDRRAESEANEQKAPPPAPPAYPYYPTVGVDTLPRGSYGWGPLPPYYAVPQLTPPARAPDRNYMINGVREPSSYFEGAFRR